jgi:hypothetical protein
MSSRFFTAVEKKSMPGFRAPKGRLTLLIEVGNFNLKSIIIYHSESSRAFKNCVNLLCLCSALMHSIKAWKTAHLFTTWFTEYFKPTAKN